MTNDEFGALYMTLREDMQKAAKRMLRVAEDAEDMVQQVFCDILASGKLPSLDGTRNVRAYVFCKLLWNVRNFLHSTNLESIEPVGLIPTELDWYSNYDAYDEGEEVDDRLKVYTDENLRIDVDRTLKALKEPYQAAVRAVVMEGKTFIEMGRDLWPTLEPYARRRMASYHCLAGFGMLRLALRDYGRN